MQKLNQVYIYIYIYIFFFKYITRNINVFIEFLKNILKDKKEIKQKMIN